MNQSFPQFTVGQEFRITGKPFHYVVTKVDAEGGVVCRDRKEEGKEVGVVHCICRTPLEYIWGLGEITLINEPTRQA